MKRYRWLIILLVLTMVFVGACGGNDETPEPVQEPTATAEPAPTDTPVPPTDTPVPPTNTPVPPTETPVPPTATPTDTPEPPTATPTNTPTSTAVPPTPTATPEPDLFIYLPVIPRQ